MRVVVAGHEIANNIVSIADALRSKYEVHSVCFGRSAMYPMASYDDLCVFRSDTQIDPIRYRLRKYWHWISKARIFFRHLFVADVFVYVWRDTFLPLKLDLLALWLLGKPTMVFQCGDDVRYRPVQYLADTKKYSVSYFGDDDHESTKRYLSMGSRFGAALYHTRMPEIFGAHVVALKSHATFHARPHYFFRFPHKVPSPRCAERLHTLIVHAPSDRTSKNTKTVEQAVSILRSWGVDFEFHLIEKVSNDELLDRIRHAAIVVDQPGPWFGRLAVEAMALGCIVVSGNRADYYGFSDRCPVHNFPTNPYELATLLRSLLTSHVGTNKAAEEFVSYYENHYGYPAFLNYFAKILAGKMEMHEPLFSSGSEAAWYLSDPYRATLVRLTWWRIGLPPRQMA